MKTLTARVQSLFIDTGAFLAQRSVADQHHSVALDGFSEIAKSGVRVFTTEHVLDETLTLLGRKINYAYAAQAGEALLKSEVLEWLRPEPEDLLTAVKWMRKYADQNISYTDAISFVVMKRHKIRHVFGFDRHFTAAGFIQWPSSKEG